MMFYEAPAVTAITYLLCEALKKSPLPTRWLPLVAAVSGALFGTAWFLISGDGTLADAIVGGMASGLAATGANEAMKLFFEKDA